MMSSKARRPAARLAGSVRSTMMLGCRLPSPAWPTVAMMMPVRSAIARDAVDQVGQPAARHGDVVDDHRAVAVRERAGGEVFQRSVGAAPGGHQRVGLGGVGRQVDLGGAGVAAAGRDRGPGRRPRAGVGRREQQRPGARCPGPSAGTPRARPASPWSMSSSRLGVRPAAVIAATAAPAARTRRETRRRA